MWRGLEKSLDGRLWAITPHPVSTHASPLPPGFMAPCLATAPDQSGPTRVQVPASVSHEILGADRIAGWRKAQNSGHHTKPFGRNRIRLVVDGPPSMIPGTAPEIALSRRKQGFESPRERH